MTYRHEGTGKEEQSDKRNDSHEDSLLLHLLRHVLYTIG